MSSRRLSYAALMIAAGLTGVYAEPFPNFEVLTLVVFCAGVLLGPRDGAIVGFLSELTYSLLNPYGAAHPLVTLAQVVGIAAAGVAGGLAARAGVPSWRSLPRAAVLGGLALILTAAFDLMTNVASGIVYGQMTATLIGGIPLSLFHVGTNVALFIVVGTPLVSVFERYRARLSPSR